MDFSELANRAMSSEKVPAVKLLMFGLILYPNKCLLHSTDWVRYHFFQGKDYHHYIHYRRSSFIIT